MKRSVFAIAICTFAAITIKAQIAVVDVRAIGQWLDQIAKMKAQIQLMQSQLQTQFDTYNHLIWQAKYLTQKSRWTSQVKAWRYPAYGNASGKTPDWAKATKDSTAAAGAWITLANKVPDILGPYSNFTSKDIKDVQRKNFAKLEVWDGTHVGAMESVADVRSVQQDREAVIHDLETAAMSDDPEQNTAAAIANKQLAAAIILLRMHQDEQRLAASAVDMSIQNGLLTRDSQTNEMARQAAFLAGHAQVSKDVLGGTSSSIKSFKGY